MQINLNYSYYSNNSSFNEIKNSNSSRENSGNNSLKNENDEQTQLVNGVKLTQKEVQEVRELQSIDRNVKAHEAAHQAAGGGLAGAASFSYTKGPDNQMYAIAGEVPIRMQKGRTPEETIANARQVMAAAMAPADPSPQDYKVAANAAKMEFEARAEAMKIKAEEAKEREKENKEKNNENSNDNNVEKTNNNLKENTKDINDRDFKNFIAKTYQHNTQNNELKFNIAS